jgi:cell wall assembly regulator SMI1
MLRTRDEDQFPLKFDDEGNPTKNDDGSKSGASTGPTLEELMRSLEKLTPENKKWRAKAKGKKTKGSSSSSEEEDSSFEEEVSKKGKKGRRNHDKTSYN